MTASSGIGGPAGLGPRSRLGRASRLALGAGAALAAVLLGYALWRHEIYASSLARAVVIYGSLAALLAACGAGLRLGAEGRLRLLLVLGSLAFVAYATELALHVLPRDPMLPVVERAAREGRTFDARSRMGVIRDLRRDGVDAWPAVVPAAMREPDAAGLERGVLRLDGEEVFLLSGIARVPTVLCNESGEYTIFEADLHGFNNPPGLWVPDGVDVAVLGDSFAMGECVPPGMDAVGRIRERIPRTLSLGYSGNSPLLSLATLLEYAERLRPRTVLWFFFSNDLSHFENGRDRRTPALLRYLDEPGHRLGLFERQGEIDRAWKRWIRSELERLNGGLIARGPLQRLADARGTRAQQVVSVAKLTRLRRRTLGLLGHRYLDFTPDLELYRRILARARDATEAWGGRFLFVYVPAVDEFGGFGPGAAQRTRSRARVLALAAEEGIAGIDLHAALARHPDPRSLYTYRGNSANASPHLNVEGYALAAEALLARLLDEPG